MKNLFKFSPLLFIAALAILLTPALGVEITGTFAAVGTASYFLVPQTANVFGMNNTNNYSARMSFKTAKDIFFNAMRNKFKPGPQGDAECQKWVDNLKLSQGETRHEVAMSTARTNFKFGVLQQDQNSDGVVYNTEKRLSQQDTLLVNEIGFFVGAPGSASATNWKLRTYGNVVDFPTSTSAVDIDSTLYSNGFLRIGVNNDVILPYRGLFNFLYRPQTQQSAFIAGASGPQTSYQDQIRGAEDGFITAEPNILLIGSKGYIPEVIIPTNLAAITANSRMVLIFRGILAQNSTITS